MPQKSVYVKLFFLLFSFSIFAQISFEKGYYIDNNGITIEGYIKNYDWQKTPDEFLFKETLDKEASTIKLEDAREFGSQKIFRFIRAYIDIDISSNDLNKVSTQKEPVYDRIKAFVKTLVEGQVSLHEYSSGNFKEYYYQKKGDKRLVPLVSKKYIDDNNNIRENNSFRSQLYQLYDLELSSDSSIKNLRYEKKSLTKFIEENNQLKGNNNSIVYKRGKTDDWFKLHIRPGLAFNKLSIDELSENNVQRDFELNSELGFRIGVLGEFVLPFNNNKWSVILESTYQSYSQESETKNISPTSSIDRTGKAAVDISSLEISTGIRHYLYFTKSSRLYINAGAMYDIWFSENLSIDSDNDGFDFELKKLRNNINAFVGMGYMYKKFALEFNLQTNQSLTANDGEFDTKYNSMAFIFSYQLF